MRMARALKLDTTQIQFMMKHAREIGNFRDLQRLEKIRKFQDPNFRYPKRRRHYLPLSVKLIPTTKKNILNG